MFAAVRRFSLEARQAWASRPDRIRSAVEVVLALLLVVQPGRLVWIVVEPAAGLNLTTGMDASGRLAFRIPDASSAALFGWTSALERDNGIAVVTPGVVENTDATLQVEGALARQAGG